MKLNPDCIRDILLATEKLETFAIEEYETTKLLSMYSHDELIYHAKHCAQNGYFNEFKYTIIDSAEISELSPDGCQMLNHIRESSGFEKVKKAVQEKGLKFTWEAIKLILPFL